LQVGIDRQRQHRACEIIDFSGWHCRAQTRMQLRVGERPAWITWLGTEPFKQRMGCLWVHNTQPQVREHGVVGLRQDARPKVAHDTAVSQRHRQALQKAYVNAIEGVIQRVPPRRLTLNVDQRVERIGQRQQRRFDQRKRWSGPTPLFGYQSVDHISESVDDVGITRFENDRALSRQRDAHRGSSSQQRAVTQQRASLLAKLAIERANQRRLGDELQRRWSNVVSHRCHEIRVLDRRALHEVAGQGTRRDVLA
jgi:hypothetical protein